MQQHSQHAIDYFAEELYVYQVLYSLVVSWTVVPDCFTD